MNWPNVFIDPIEKVKVHTNQGSTWIQIFVYLMMLHVAIMWEINSNDTALEFYILKASVLHKAVVLAWIHNLQKIPLEYWTLPLVYSTSPFHVSFFSLAAVYEMVFLSKWSIVFADLALACSLLKQFLGCTVIVPALKPYLSSWHPLTLTFNRWLNIPEGS